MNATRISHYWTLGSRRISAITAADIALTDAEVLRFGEIAPRLIRLNYQPIPVYPDTKRPSVLDWRNYHFDQSRPDSRPNPRKCAGKLIFPNYATGIVTGRVVGVDIDVRDKKIVQKLKSLVDKVLGPGPDRVGAAPKFLRVFRTEKQFAKIHSRNFSLPGDDTKAEGYEFHAGEVLGAGQQFVFCEALHNKTGKPYQWSNGAGLLTIPVTELTVVSEAQCVNFIAKLESVLLKCGAKIHGGKAVEIKTVDSANPCVKVAVPVDRKFPPKLRRELDRDLESVKRFAITATPLHSKRAIRANVAPLSV